MSTALVRPQTLDRATPDRPLDPEASEALAELQSYFGADFTLWDAESGCVLRRGRGQPPGDESVLPALLAAVVRDGGPQLVAVEDHAVQLAIPLGANRQPPRAALAAFATAHPRPEDHLTATAGLLGWGIAETRRWLQHQTLWTPEALERLARAVVDKRAAEAESARLEHEIEDVSANLVSTYEEISLLYDMIRNMRISSREESTAEVALELLSEYLPAQAIAIQYLPIADDGRTTYQARNEALWMAHGESPIDSDRFSDLVAQLGLGAGSDPFVANRGVTGGPDWPAPEVRQVIITPLCEGDNLFAWLAAINHARDEEFGTVEASLLSSLGVMLGIHSSNRELYRQLAAFLADVVRAMTSAIDAKDPYTCGHSDRVARISVRLAQQLGWQADALNTVYMAGLLHDIGKIGVDEKVLRKPGRLTDEEYEHIKRHPGLGHKILVDIRPLSDVLPAVLHHHEQWDGGGYPQGLAAEAIPEIARIVAVADAYDAMTSNRPYRKGMPLERVHEILRSGVGRHWDARVVEAYFQARDDILRICQEDPADLALDAQWS